MQIRAHPPAQHAAHPPNPPNPASALPVSASPFLQQPRAAAQHVHIIMQTTARIKNPIVIQAKTTQALIIFTQIFFNTALSLTKRSLSLLNLQAQSPKIAPIVVRPPAPDEPLNVD